MKQEKIKLAPHQYLALALLSLSLLLEPTNVAGQLLNQSSQQVPLVAGAAVPVLDLDVGQGLAHSAQLLSSLTAQSVYVLDKASHATLLEKTPHDLRYPASTTKLITALVARDLYQLDDTVTVTGEVYTTGNVMGLSSGETLSVKTLLEGLLISSGNDAAFALANNHPGGYQDFVKDMNNKAKSLGLEQSSFQNPSGLDEPNHQTTARDLALAWIAVVDDEYLGEIVTTAQRDVYDSLGTIQHRLVSTHQLLGKYPGVVGGKTGTTPLAQEVLVTQVERDNHAIVIVVLGSSDRYLETKNITDWVFSAYDWQAFPRAVLD